MANTHSLDLERSSSQYAYAGDSASLSITGDISIECWIKLEQLPSDIPNTFPLISKYDYGANKRSYTLGIQSDDKLSFIFSNNGSDYAYSVSDSVAVTETGVWYHFAATADVSQGNAGIILYKDGSAIASTGGYVGSDSTSILDSDQNFTIGCFLNNTTPVAFVDGKIDEARVWNDIRTAGEISSNYRRQLNGNESGLVAYYKFNNDDDDATSNNNDLTLVNTPVYSTDVPFIGFIPRIITI